MGEARQDPFATVFEFVQNQLQFHEIGIYNLAMFGKNVRYFSLKLLKDLFTISQTDAIAGKVMTYNLLGY